MRLKRAHDPSFATLMSLIEMNGDVSPFYDTHVLDGARHGDGANLGVRVVRSWSSGLTLPSPHPYLQARKLTWLHLKAIRRSNPSLLGA